MGNGPRWTSVAGNEVNKGNGENARNGGEFDIPNRIQEVE